MPHHRQHPRQPRITERSMTKQLEKYITAHYYQWVEYALIHIRLSRQNFTPEEVVNDVLCVLISRDTDRMELLMSRKTITGTELDYFLKRIIKITIQSPRSLFRFKRGQHCLDHFNDGFQNLPEVVPDFDYDRAYLIVRKVFDDLEISTLSKRIFAWRFFEGRSFSEWQGRESKKYLYETFNRVMLIISSKIRKKDLA